MLAALANGRWSRTPCLQVTASLGHAQAEQDRLEAKQQVLSVSRAQMHLNHLAPCSDMPDPCSARLTSVCRVLLLNAFPFSKVYKLKESNRKLRERLTELELLHAKSH